MTMKDATAHTARVDRTARSIAAAMTTVARALEAPGATAMTSSLVRSLSKASSSSVERQSSRRHNWTRWTRRRRRRRRRRRVAHRTHKHTQVFIHYMYATAATTTTATTMRAALGKTAQLGARHGRIHAGARASRGAARAQQQDEEQQEQQQQQSSSSSMQKSPMGGSTPAFRRGALPVGLTSLLGRDFPSVMSSPFALTDRMFDMLDFPSEFREMYEPFQRLMHRDSVSALPDKLPFAVNILEKKDHYLLTADLPGLNTKNVKVSVDSDKQLHIKALRESRHEEESDDVGVKIHAYERSFGSYDRKFQLPESVDADAEDAVQASMKDGVLSVRIKKTPSPEPEIPKPTERQIEIKTAA